MTASRLGKGLILSALLLSLAAAESLKADTLESQHWPVLSAAQLDALINTISGEKALDHIRYITQYWRWAPSREFHEVAEYVVNQAKSYGLADAHVERFIADGKSLYLGVPMYRPSWDPRAGELWVMDPVKEKITSFADIPTYIAGYSRNTDVYTSGESRKLRIFGYTWQSESSINPYNATPSETLNFIDGKRSSKEIRDAVSAEYDPVPLDVIEELMDSMAGAKIVDIRTR
jgi:hypothetical protein